MKQEPIAEAEELIRENLSGPPLHTLTPSRESPLASRTIFVRPLSGGPSDVSGSLAEISHSSETGLSPQTGALAIRKKRQHTRPVFHDYGDGNRETYEVDHFASAHPSRMCTNSDLNQSAYVPVPPFNMSDLQLRKQKRREA
ncbi:hypothetical protein N7513_010816 [Penicillium frequentans]|nr:hypothetical protein N7513_010816 [Penicillium glabrum]